MVDGGGRRSDRGTKGTTGRCSFPAGRSLCALRWSVALTPCSSLAALRRGAWEDMGQLRRRAVSCFFKLRLLSRHCNRPDQNSVLSRASLHAPVLIPLGRERLAGLLAGSLGSSSEGPQSSGGGPQSGSGSPPSAFSSSSSESGKLRAAQLCGSGEPSSSMAGGPSVSVSCVSPTFSHWMPSTGGRRRHLTFPGAPAAAGCCAAAASWGAPQPP